MMKKMTALVCLLALLVSMLSACSLEELLDKLPLPDDFLEESDSPATKAPDKDEEENESTEPQATLPAFTMPSFTMPQATEPDYTDLGITAIAGLEKLTTLTMSTMYQGSSGFYYRDNDTRLHGIISVDGKYDSGAIYYNVDVLADYFKITLQQPSDPNNLDSLNCTGLVDGEGNVIIPAEYAVIKKCENERFFQVIKVTEITDSKEEALVYLTSKMFSITASDEDILYKGVWYIYDTQTQKIVDGVSATNGYSSGVSGDMIFYTDDDGKYVKVNTEGKPFPENAQVFEDGSYYFRDQSTVYDAFGNKMFDFDSDKYDSISLSNGYYRCRSYSNSGSTYVILDKTGKQVSVEFSGYLYVYGENLVTVDDVPHDFSGNKLVDMKATTVMQYDGFWYLKNYETHDFHVLNSDLELLFSGNEDDGFTFEGYYGLLKKEVGDDTLYYSFKDQDFVFAGSSEIFGFISSENEAGTCDLINTLTGETYLTGYRYYTVDKAKDNAIYIVASHSDGFWDVYVMQ